MFATGLSSKTAKVGASPLEGGFGGCCRAFRDRGDLVDRVVLRVLASNASITLASFTGSVFTMFTKTTAPIFIPVLRLRFAATRAA
jgi:hypothetical protein